MMIDEFLIVDRNSRIVIVVLLTINSTIIVVYCGMFSKYIDQNIISTQNISNIDSKYIDHNISNICKMYIFFKNEPALASDFTKKYEKVRRGLGVRGSHYFKKNTYLVGPFYKNTYLVGPFYIIFVCDIMYFGVSTRKKRWIIYSASIYIGIFKNHYQL